MASLNTNVSCFHFSTTFPACPSRKKHSRRKSVLGDETGRFYCTRCQLPIGYETVPGGPGSKGPVTFILAGT